MNRRTMIGVGAALLSTGGRAATATGQPPSSADAEVVPLWPAGLSGPTPPLRLRLAGASDDRVATGIAVPSLTVYRPLSPDGSALLIVPGGGYMEERIDTEGSEIARRFNLDGVTTFVLTYRLPSEGWVQGPAAPLEDALRAMRLVRANAARFGIEPSRIGAIGFSAGGHLAASLSTRNAESIYAPVDDVDRASARPTFFAVGYPVITMLAPFAHEASREHLLGKSATIEQRTAWSAERFVTSDTPPGFLFATVDDPYVPIENTTMLFAAMRANQVQGEMHIFERGGHGFGLRLPSTAPAASWPDLLLRWGRERGYFRKI
jgi:acetyl esterase/lipase